MFYERVTRLKLELAGDFADTNCNVARKSSTRPEDRIHHPRYLQPWFDRAFRQHEICLQRVRNIIFHDFECAFRLRVREGHAELVEAFFWETLPGNFPLGVPEKNGLVGLVVVLVAGVSVTLATKPFHVGGEDFIIMLLLETLED